MVQSNQQDAPQEAPTQEPQLVSEDADEGPVIICTYIANFDLPECGAPAAGVNDKGYRRCSHHMTS